MRHWVAILQASLVRDASSVTVYDPLGGAPADEPDHPMSQTGKRDAPGPWPQAPPLVRLSPRTWIWCLLMKVTVRSLLVVQKVSQPEGWARRSTVAQGRSLAASRIQEGRMRRLRDRVLPAVTRACKWDKRRPASGCGLLASRIGASALRLPVAAGQPPAQSS